MRQSTASSAGRLALARGFGPAPVFGALPPTTTNGAHTDGCAARLLLAIIDVIALDSARA